MSKRNIAVLLFVLLQSVYSYPEEQCWGHLVMDEEQHIPSSQLTFRPYHFNSFHSSLLNQSHQVYLPFTHPRACSQWKSSDYRNFLIKNFGYGCPKEIGIDTSGLSFFGADDNYYYYVPDRVRYYLLEQWQLYEFAEFWHFIKTYPDYERCLEKVFQEIHTDSQVKKQLSNQASANIHDEHKKLQQTKAARIKAAEEVKRVREEEQKRLLVEQRNQVQENFLTQQADLVNSYEELQEVVDFQSKYEFGSLDRLAKRSVAYEELQEKGIEYQDASYCIPQEAATLLSKSGCDSKLYKSCYGNQLQQVVHQDCIGLLEQAASLKTTSSVYSYQTSLIECIDAAREYNQQGFADRAIMINDFCGALLDYGSAIIGGMVEGALGAAQDCLEHPVQTLACAVAGEYVLAYQLSKVLWNVADIGITSLIDPGKGVKKWRDYIEPVDKIIDAIANKQIGLRDAVKGGVQLAVHWKAQNKLLGGLGKLYKTTKVRVSQFADKNSLIPLEECAATPEGVLLSVGALPDKHKAKLSVRTISAPKREIVLPRYKTYEQARNKAFEIIGDIDIHSGIPMLGKQGVVEGKLCGRRWHGNKVTLRLDHDFIKGAHINATDYRNGKKLSIAIPFDGDSKNIASLCRPLNTQAELMRAKKIFDQVGDVKSSSFIEKLLDQLEE